VQGFEDAWDTIKKIRPQCNIGASQRAMLQRCLAMSSSNNTGPQL
jgi:hypothetical protein